MKNRLSSFVYFWKEGIKNIFVHGFMSFAAISIIIICLIITGTVTLVSYNIDLQIVKLQQQSELIFYVDESFSESEAKDIATQLQQIENIASISFTPRDQALEEYRDRLGENAMLLDGFTSDNNPLRNGYSVTMHDVSLIEQTRAQIQAINGVANIRVNEDVIVRLLQIQSIFNTISIVLVIALGLISIFIISNTVKLAMVARRAEISIQKTVGATNAFIRWPFVIEGLLLGVFAGCVAFGLEYLLYEELSNLVYGMINSFAMIEFTEIYLMLAAVFVGAGAVVGVGGSVLTIRRFLDV